MNYNKTSLFTGLFFFLFPILLSAQEVCNNGIDDDNDGLVDCYDGDCISNEACEKFFYNIPAPDDSNCISPKPVTNFEFEILWQSDFGTSTATPYAADINNDGIIEIIANGDVISGSTGEVLGSLFGALTDIAIGDVDKDGLAEIFAPAPDFSNNSPIKCFNSDFTEKWISDSSFLKVSNYPKTNLADFNYDGVPEVWVGDLVLNAVTGAYIARIPLVDFSPPVAADLLDQADCADCEGLELTDGRQIYSVNIETGTITLVMTAPPGSPDGESTIADIDLDGNLDIVMGSVTGPFGSGSQLYIWSPSRNIQLGQTISMPGIAQARANPGNFNGDNLVDIAIGGNQFFTLFSYDPVLDSLIEQWRTPVSDNSGSVGSTSFDFDCNGIFDIVYRGDTALYIIQGDNGQVLKTYSCISVTNDEVPVVVDVNADGSADILCGCERTNGSQGIEALSNINNSWSPSRKVFNQYNYSAVNINDDLSIPRQQQNHAHPDLPALNGYMNQPTLRDEFGNPICYDIIPKVDISFPSDTSICFGGSVMLAVENAASASWQPITGVSDPNITNPVLSPKTTTTYTIIAEDATGCTKDSQTIEVFVDNVISLPVEDTILLFQGNCIQINDFDWPSFLSKPLIVSNGDSSFSFPLCPVQNTFYEIIFTDNNGCISKTGFFCKNYR